MNITLGTIIGAFFIGFINALILVMQICVVIGSLGLLYVWIEKKRELKIKTA